MKKIILLVTMILMTNAFATDLASYTFGLDFKNANGSYSRLFSQIIATITDNKVMKVKSKISPGIIYDNKDFSSDANFDEIQLSDQSYNILLNEIKRLSKAEIVNEYFDIVCQMMPSPTQAIENLSVRRGFDFQTGEFNGVIKKVQGPSGCWVRNKIYPKSIYAQHAANSLKSSIKILVAQLISRDL